MELLTIISLLALTIYTASAAGSPDNIGREFILAFSANTPADQTNPRALQLFITTAVDTPANYKIRTPGDPTLMVEIEGSVSKGYVKDVTIPSNLMAWAIEISRKVIHITSDADIVVFGANKLKMSIDGFLVLPLDTLGRNHFVLTYREANPPSKTKSRTTFLIATGKFPTTIAVQLPRRDFDKEFFSLNEKAFKGGSSLVLNLDKYTTFQVSSKLDLTGTQVISDHPIALFAGNERESVIIPSKTQSTSDYLIEQLPAVDKWGKEFVTTPLKGISNQKFRIIASENDTVLKIDGRMIKVMNGAEFYTYTTDSSQALGHVSTSKPILMIVLGISESKTPGDAKSDTFMALVTPIQQYGKALAFSTISKMRLENPTMKHFVNIVARTDRYSGLQIDGTPLPKNLKLSRVKGTDYSATQLEITAGGHSVSHKNLTATFNVFVYGYRDLEAYGFPGGMRLVNLNSCERSSPVDSDGIDNDCDGQIDEELLNNIDDDNDGAIDEDFIKPPKPVANETSKTADCSPASTLTVLYCPTTSTTEATTETTESPTTYNPIIKSTGTEVPDYAGFNDRKYLSIMIIICSVVTLGIPLVVLFVCCCRSLLCCGGTSVCVRDRQEPEEKDDFVVDVPVSFDDIKESGSVEEGTSDASEKTSEEVKNNDSEVLEGDGDSLRE